MMPRDEHEPLRTVSRSVPDAMATPSIALGRAPADLALGAASAASAAITGLIEAARDADDVATHLRFQEVAENLADALQSALLIEQAAPREDDTPEEREMVGQLLAAVSRFLEGWA